MNNEEKLATLQKEREDLQERQTKLKEQRAEITRQMEEIENAIFDGDLPLLMKSEGKTFVYRHNSGSCPEEGEYWDTYRRVMKIIPDTTLGWARVVWQTFQINHEGCPEIKIEHNLLTGNLPVCGFGFKLCAKREFDRAFKKVSREILNPKSAIAFQSKDIK